MIYIFFFINFFLFGWTRNPAYFLSFCSHISHVLHPRHNLIAKHDLQNLSDESPATKKEYPEASVLKRISLTALQDIPFITLTSEQNIGKIYRTLCATLAFQPNTVITCTNIETALSLVNRQLGATLIPEILAYQTPEFTQVQYYLVEQFDNTRPICLVYRKNQYQHDNLKTLLDIFREVVPALYQNNS